MITADRRPLLRALSLASLVIRRHRSIPALDCIKMSANGVLALESTNLDTTARVEMPYDDGGQHEEMSFLLPNSRGLVSAINAAGGSDVRFAAAPEDKRIFMGTGMLTSQLYVQKAEDFPTLDSVEHEEFSVQLGEAELRQIARVCAAISQEETRYYLNGVCVRHLGDWTYRFAATDGHRLMQVDIPLPGAQGVMPDWTIIPSEWLRLALAQFRKAKHGATLRYGRGLVRNDDGGPMLPIDTPGGRRIALTADMDGVRFTLTSKLIDGKYPDYDRVIPTGYSHLVRLRRGALAQAINALSGLSLEKTRAIRLTFGEGMLNCSLKSPDLGDSHFEIVATHNLPADREVGLNGRLALDMLAAFTGEEVELHMHEETGLHPILWRDPADTAFLAVLMPMRL